MGQIIPFNYEGIALRESYWQDGNPFFSARAIGEFLEYAHPVQDVNRIVKRNPHINDPQWSVVAKLATTDGKKYDTRLYDPIGLQLIMFESGQPKAIQYKIAAAHLIVAYMKGELKPSKWALKDDLMSAIQQIKSLPRGTKRGELVRDLAERDGVNLTTAYRRIRLATGEHFKSSKGTFIQRSDKGTTRRPDEKEKVLAYTKTNPTARGAHIKRELNLQTSFERINGWIRESRR